MYDILNIIVIFNTENIWLFRQSKPVSFQSCCKKVDLDIKVMKLSWLQADILVGQLVQTSTQTPPPKKRKNYTKVFFSGFVTN